MPSVGGAIRRAPGQRGKNEGGLGREEVLSFPDPPRSRSRLDLLVFSLADLFVHYHQSTVGKKMVDVHFTTIPWERNSAISTEKAIFCRNLPRVLTKLCMQGLEFSDLFCAFLRAVLGFLCAKRFA